MLLRLTEGIIILARCELITSMMSASVLMLIRAATIICCAGMIGFMLVGAADEVMPEDIEIASISGRGIQDVETADLSFFVNLRDLDLSDNQIRGMDLLKGFMSLRRLVLSSNHLRSLGALDPTSFDTLEVLDLR